MYLGLIVEDVDRTLARLSLLKHMHTNTPGQSHRHQQVAESYERARNNARAESYVTETLLAVGSRRMGACMRGEPWCDEFTGSMEVKARWAAFRKEQANAA